jgi:hypothetical protein
MHTTTPTPFLPPTPAPAFGSEHIEYPAAPAHIQSIQKSIVFYHSLHYRIHS